MLAELLLKLYFKHLMVKKFTQYLKKYTEKNVIVNK